MRASTRPDREEATLRAEDFALGEESPSARPRPTGREPSSPRLPEGSSLREAVELYKRSLVEAALRRHDGSWAAASRELGMHRSNLFHLAKRLGVTA